MAHMSQDKKKELAPAIKAVFKKYNVKATLGVRHHSSLVANIKSSPIDFDLGERTYSQANVYQIENHHKGIAQKFLLELRAAMMVGNFDNSDAHTDYFHVGWYIEPTFPK